MAKLYKYNGEIQDVEPKSQKDGFKLDELYNLIGDGCELVEIIEYAPGKIFVCDEEFRLRDGWQDRRNKTANDLIFNETGNDWDLAGNVLLCNDDEVK